MRFIQKFYIEPGDGKLLSPVGGTNERKGKKKNCLD